MPSNSTRVRNQLIANPLALGATAAVTWPLSWVASEHTNWTAGGAQFSDFWMGSTAVIFFLCSVALTIAAFGFAMESLNKWLTD